ncbi:hypothetical protein [Kitasatospora sp. NPDC056184]|uniref:hypothetical protein n=1 Tax=Kitasatospora sp. NPDC056184 TaxID=3345738 RepID=UPI0035DF75E5
MLRLAARAASALALAGALVLNAGTPALADPPVPAATDIVGAGSPVTQSLYNQFSADYNASLAAAGNTTSPRLYSWDGTGNAYITPKTGAESIVRPPHTLWGLFQLAATTSRTLDFARTNRGPQTGDREDALFVALAKDAVTWAAPAGGHAPANLSAWMLKQIYTCAYTNWQQIDPALPNATIHPVLPSARGDLADTALAFFRGLSYTLGSYTSFGDCVTVTGAENQGTSAVLQDPDAIVPYSVGRYVGQVYGGHTTPGDGPGALTLRSLEGIAPLSPQDTGATISRSLALTEFGYVLTTAVRRGDWDAGDAHATALRSIFGIRGWTCSPTGLAVVRSHGFLVLPMGACGVTLHI